MERGAAAASRSEEMASTVHDQAGVARVRSVGAICERAKLVEHLVRAPGRALGDNPATKAVIACAQSSSPCHREQIAGGVHQQFSVWVGSVGATGLTAEILEGRFFPGSGRELVHQAPVICAAID